jgi:hypothetical protein
MEIEEYLRSFEPPGQRGRPKQTKPAAPTRRLNPELALRAYALHCDGVHWWTIARALYPDLPAAERDSDAVRKRIERLIDRGQTLAMESPEKNLDESNSR